MTDSTRFTLAKVKGGWQIYDVARREHIGRVWHSDARASAMLADIRSRSPRIARWILTGSTK